MRRWISIILVACASPMLAGAANASLVSEEKPSIILISIDTLRADHLSCYGYRPVETPHLDALGKGGTLFSAANSQVPLTLPSHLSLLTSTYPFFNGIEDNGETVAPKTVTLATLFKSRGYRTGAFVGGFPLDRRFGLGQGFDVYDSTFNEIPEIGSDDIKRLGADVVAAANRWLDANSNSPLFLFLHLYDLHSPYNLPASYSTRFGTGYDAELRYVDEQVGIFWDSLHRHNLLERTLVILTADHGESLGEHGETTHGYFIYQSTLWVPLILHWPAASGSFPAKIDEPVGLIDVAPTILQFAGISPPAEFQGRSLMELWRSGAPKTTRDVYSENLSVHMHFGCSSLRALRTGRYKYIDAPKPELYDLATDPGETRNLYLQQRPLALASKQKMAVLRARYQGQRPLRQSPLDPQSVARLRSLGYVARSSEQPDSSDRGVDPKDRIGEAEGYLRAVALISSGRREEAHDLLKQVLTKCPELLDARVLLGLTDQGLGRHNEAAGEFEQMVKADPLNVQAHYHLGQSLIEVGRLDQAARELEAALALEPYYAPAEDLLGSIAMQKSDYDRARERFEHVLSFAPGDYTAHYNLGKLAALQGQSDEAEQHLRMAMALDSVNPEPHNALGSLYLQKGDLDKAAGEFETALRFQPKSAPTHYNLGLVFRKQKKENAAAGEFRHALAIDPQFRPAREALSQPTSN